MIRDQEINEPLMLLLRGSIQKYIARVELYIE
jgi:hypothetical protein